MSTPPTTASNIASTTATWGPTAAHTETETPSFFSESNGGQSSGSTTSGNQDAKAIVVAETNEKKGGGGGGGGSSSGGKGGKGGKGGGGDGGDGGQTSLSTTPLGGKWINNFYTKHYTLHVGPGSDVHEEDEGPGGEDADVYQALESIIADAKEQLGTVSDEQNNYRDFLNMLNQLLEQAKDRKNWVDVAEKYNEYVAELNDEINAVRSGTAVSHKNNLPFTKIALAAAGTFGMLYGSF